MFGFSKYFIIFTEKLYMNKISLSENLVRSLYKRYCNGESISKIVKTEDIGTKTVAKVFSEFNKLGLIYKPNENYFDIIDSEEKAYYLGLIAADGTIVKNNTINKGKISKSKILNISLQEIDGYILEKLNQAICPYKKLVLYDLKIKNWSKRITFRVSSIEICNQLQKYNIEERKTFKEYSIPKIPKQLVPHYIRGFFDGDGCCYKKLINHHKHTKKGNYTNKVSFASLTRTILDSIQTELNLGKVYERKKSGNRQNIFILDIERKVEVQQFYNYIYKNATIYLKRKKEKFI